MGDRTLSPVAMATLVHLNIHLGGSSLRKWIDAELAHFLKDMSVAINDEYNTPDVNKFLNLRGRTRKK